MEPSEVSAVPSEPIVPPQSDSPEPEDGQFQLGHYIVFGLLGALLLLFVGMFFLLATLAVI